MMKAPLKALIPVLAAFLAIAVYMAAQRNFLYAAVILGVGIVLSAVSAAVLIRYHKRLCAQMDDVFNNNAMSAFNLINSVGVPCLLIDQDGRIIWRNESFASMSDAKDVLQLMPGYDSRYPPKNSVAEVSGRHFQVVSAPVARASGKSRRITFQYWLDRTEAQHYSRLYEEQMPTVALIYADNYDELASDKQFHRNAVLSEVEKCVSEFVATVEGAYRRYDNTRFFIVFEAKYLAELEKQRFKLLDRVRTIETGTPQSVTLSIAVGAASRIAQSDESARQAMELALGRGGDQAVVKRGTGYAFYGGRRQVTTRHSRVKTRLFAKALRQLMETSNDVFIMGHRHPDMDCMGAALGLIRCARIAGKHARLILEEGNPTIDSVLSAMQQNVQYHECVCTPDQAGQLMHAGSVLIIVDTQRASSIVAPSLYDNASKTVIIDHHRRPVDSLQNPTLSYLEAGASSASEMVSEVLQYFDDNPKPTSFECDALLAGIMLDTKQFAYNTGTRTFEAASYLRRNGADTGIIKKMFQDDREMFLNRARVVESAQILSGGIALAVCPDGMPNAALLAAQAADALITIKGITASFVMAQIQGQGSDISISGRSLGQINVQLILERIGGGGHLTMAGAQLKDISMSEAVSQLRQSIQAYLKEADKK